MAMDAMKSAVKQAYALALEEVDKSLENYLKKKPKIYKRLANSPLATAYDPIEPRGKKKGDTYTFTFGIKYNADKFKGIYKSNSWYHQSGGKWVSSFSNRGAFNFDSQSNGIPDSEWILNNYLSGVHPGYDKYGGNNGWVDAESPSDRMTKFFEKELPSKMGSLIYEAMHGAVVDFLNTNGGGK